MVLNCKQVTASLSLLVAFKLFAWLSNRVFVAFVIFVNQSYITSKTFSRSDEVFVTEY